MNTTAATKPNGSFSVSPVNRPLVSGESLSFPVCTIAKLSGAEGVNIL
ncbi:hypothetical protein [Beduinella massiliensis]